MQGWYCAGARFKDSFVYGKKNVEMPVSHYEILSDRQTCHTKTQLVKQKF